MSVCDAYLRKTIQCFDVFVANLKHLFGVLNCVLEAPLLDSARSEVKQCGDVYYLRFFLNVGEVLMAKSLDSLLVR
jgi:hypothetical protein